MSTLANPSVQVPTADQVTSGGRRKKVLLLALVVVVVLAAGWWYFLKPSTPKPPEPGEVMTLEPIQVNLANGQYLRIGIALQLTADAYEADGSQALDAVIDLFSGVEQTELIKAGQRNEFKERLEQQLEEDYHGDVMEVYFTEFVTQ